MTENKKIDWRIALGAIAGLVVLEIFAMHYGINGKVFAVIIGAICGLAGLSLPQIKFK